MNSIRSLPQSSLFLRASFFWVGLCVLAFLNGALREVVLRPMLDISEPLANQISCATGVLIWTLFTIWNWSRLNITSLAQAVKVGFGWLFATLIFETLIIDRNLSWTQIIETYDIYAGQYWGLVVLWIGLMPVILFYALNFRRYINGWGATATEQVERIDGSEVLHNPRIASTQAVTINTNPEKIWPWLVQMGEGRGGFYSYAWLENLVGSKIKNAFQIVPRFQSLKKGDSISLHAKAPKLRVTVFDVNRTLAFEGWIFHLEKTENSKTRLISRVYTENKPEMGYFYNLIMTSFLFDLAHFIMSRKQLLTIKKLCESN